ncbi:Hydrophobin-like protein ssgA [Metarhizium brunneum]|uniref:Hydrophobin n=1 Tax=Metarhizium brunneum TaxID=500148 RepID=A0A7D5Z1U5_9HYPO
MFKALIVALAAVAAAIPTQQPSSNKIECNNTVFCCDKQTVGQAGIPIDALNPTCTNLNVLAVDALNPPCPGQTVCCNNVQQNGVVNVACTPISA